MKACSVQFLLKCVDEHANEWVYSGLEAVDDFGKSLFSQKENCFRPRWGNIHLPGFLHTTEAVSTTFLSTRKDPKVIFGGSSIICIKVFEKRLIFMDSNQFLPMRLADMPTTLGVSDVAKGFFPYRLHTPELWDKRIDKPEIEDFEPDFMSIS